MYAKLIICEEELGILSDTPANHSLLHRNQISQVDEHVHWQMTASDLTSGKLIELLVYLDKLGFRDTEN